MFNNQLSKIAAGLIVVACASTTFAWAHQHEGYNAYSIEGTYEDVMQDLQDAIINKGLVIDSVGHVDEMLERTSEAVDSVTAAGDKSPFSHAKYVLFCSAKLTHDAVSANPFNLAMCPYTMFIFETHATPGKIVVGYRQPIPGPSKKSRQAVDAIRKLLDDISREATGQ